MKFQQLTMMVVCCLIMCLGINLPELMAENLTDPLNLGIITQQSRMNKKGWPILAARNGGWGRFPEHYTYQRVELDDTACLIDSYPHSQTHGSSNAIMLDWDGDATNGNTALTPTPGMRLTFEVSVFMQPWAHNGGNKYWVRDGAGMVLWQMGPGVVAADHKPISDIKKEKPDYSWQTNRGPRIGYYTGEVPGYEPAKMPVIQAFLPQAEIPAVQLPLSQANQWMDLKLTVQLADDLKSASCCASMKPAGQDKWITVGDAWSFPLDMSSDSSFNPARWNALILDMPHAIWAPKGYGNPNPNIVDRYRGFAVSVSNVKADEKARRCELMRFDRQNVAAQITLPTSIFAGETLQIPMALTNASDKPLHGNLLLKINDKVQTLASDWTLPGDGRWKSSSTFVPDLSMNVELLLQSSDGKEQSLAQSAMQVIAAQCPKPLDNVMRNASFELPAMFCGSAMRQGHERLYVYAKSREKRMWTELPIEGWWAQGDDAQGITLDTQNVHTGKQSVKITAENSKVTMVSAPGSWLPQGDVTVSAWIKTQQAKAVLQLDLLASDEPVIALRADIRKEMALPVDSDWQRVSMTVPATSLMQALVRVSSEQGSVWIDDVQVQGASQAGVFDLRRAEWIRMQLPEFEDADVPMWVAGKQVTHALEISCDARQLRSGYVTISMGSWDHPGKQPLGRVELSQITGGRTEKLPFPTGKLAPGTYVITADYHADDTTVYRGVDQFDAMTRIGGTTSNSLMRSRQVLCFAIIPDYEPAKIFGIGNGMLDTKGDYFAGYTLDDYQWAGQLGYVCYRGRYNVQAQSFLVAAGGMPAHRMETLRLSRDASRNPAIQNPAVPGELDLANPLAQEQFIKQAREIALQNGKNPQIASYQMANERPFYTRDGLCPTDAADADFRAFCQKLHGDLATLNKRWGTTYTSWVQVEQPLSAAQLEIVTQQEQLKGAAATAWTAVYGKMSKQVNELIQKIPGRGMDWYRWRTAFSLRMYKQFVAEARKVDKKTMYSTNLCWPNFWPQLAMPFFRAMDVTMLDMEYSAGQFRGLGTPAEMMEIMEMFESNAPDKPMWGIEVYTQPQWPAASTALQNWGLLAHGMTNNLIFGWRPYSDHGRVKGNRAWEQPDAHPMWFIIDNDGTKLPSFDAVEKTKTEIHTFHKQFDALSLKRLSTKTAIYLSDDMSEYLSYSTANKPYNTGFMHARNSLIYLMRLAGLQADYLDEQLLGERLKAYDTLILPPTEIISDASAARIADFVEAGGKLILVGASGQYDPWINKRSQAGGLAWQSLGWQMPEYRYEASQDGSHLFGQNIGKMTAGKEIRDDAGQLLGWHKPWGKGQVIAMGIYPCVYNKNPHMPLETMAWMQALIKAADLSVVARWIPSVPVGEVDPELKHGQGSSVVEVVLRPKSERKVFAFVLNQGGAGEGVLQYPLHGSSQSWQVRDALSGQPVESRITQATLEVVIPMDAFGYRVLLLER